MTEESIAAKILNWQADDKNLLVSLLLLFSHTIKKTLIYTEY